MNSARNGQSERDVILMTSAIGSPPAFLKITNHEDRLHQTLCGLVRWIRDTSAKTIVFCDGTMPSFDFSKVLSFAEEHGKNLEVILFRESDNYLKYGKGYAEGEVLEYALNHSKHLAEGGSFYKVTGRTFIANFDEIRALHEHDEAVFASPAWSLMPESTHETHSNLSSKIKNVRAIGFGTAAKMVLSGAERRFYNLFFHGEWSPREHRSVWTQFYKCDVSFFRRHLLKAYVRVSDLYNNIEHEYFRSMRGVPFAPMGVRMRIVGRNAGYDLQYDEEYSEEVQALARTLR